MTGAAGTGPTRRDNQRQHAEARGLAGRDWAALGTTAHLVVTAPDRLAAAHAAVVEVLRDIDLAASRFRDDSEIAEMNRAAGAWVPVSELLVHALRVALDAAELTEGLVDPTVGAALVDLGYDRTFALVAREAPDAVVRVRRAPGWRSVELDEAGGRVRVPAGTIVDLGATAKGLAADLAAQAAARAAGCGVLVGLGGDIAVAGSAPDEGWPISVADTSSLDVAAGAEPEQVVVIRDGGLATSSIRARRWRRGGSELHHVLDPRVGRPADAPYRTVSVAAKSCALANAASTAAVILGFAAPGWLADGGFPARLVTRGGDVVRVCGWPAESGR